MSFVKLKNKNKKSKDNRITLGAKHNEMLGNIDKNKERLPKKKRQLINLRNEYRRLEKSESLFDENSFTKARKKLQIEDKIKKLEQEIDDIENNKQEQEYFFNTSNILLEYYKEDQVELENQDANNFSELNSGNSMSSTRNIQHFFEQDNINAVDDSDSFDSDYCCNNVSENIEGFVKRKQTSNKGILLDEYMEKVDPNYVNPNKEKKSKVNMCPHCNIERKIMYSEGLHLCTRCGVAEQVIMESEKPSFRDPVPENSYFAYRRINHMKEWIQMFQAKETTVIPQDVYDMIIIEIKKERINNLATLNHDILRRILKKLRLNKYYEHIPQIINKLNKLPPPIISREIEEKLCAMFMEIQPAFKKCCPSSRKNFLSYSYTLHKMTELLDLPQFSKCFNLLKSREKLKQQDRIWKCICEQLGYEFYPSI